MNQFPVQCQNCYSHKRQFYVFLQCKHFMCLSCCLCLADFQNLTIRCCHRNTKMSQQLATVMFQEIRTRSKSKQIQYQVYMENQKQVQNIYKQKYDPNNLKKNLVKQKSVQKTVPQRMDQSHIVHTFKLIDQSVQKSPKRQSFKQIKQVNKKDGTNVTYKSCQKQKYLLTQSSQDRQIQFPTFKQIRQSNEGQNNTKYETKNEKQNYICWKNHDTTKDRILAKLNYHQQKMNALIKQHY